MRQTTGYVVEPTSLYVVAELVRYADLCFWHFQFNFGNTVYLNLAERLDPRKIRLDFVTKHCSRRKMNNVGEGKAKHNSSK